jgi:hypothetical protein
MRSDHRTRRDRHALNADGMVLCNPRDKEAAHRAQMGDIATGEGASTTCPKCMALARSAHEPSPPRRDQNVRPR